MPATRVTTVPTTMETTIVRGAKTVPAFGRSIPSATKIALSPLASPTPRKRPMADATSPMTMLSSRTERKIWRREAPIVRSVANSRALGDRDRDGVEDHERPDEQGDRPEGQQQVADDADALRDGLLVRLGLLVGGLHLRPGGQEGLDLARERALRHARLRGHRDR